MFKTTKDSKVKKAKAQGSVTLPVGTVTLISKGTALDGNATVHSDVRIDGTVNGNITCDKKVVVGDNGEVNGNVNCAFLEIHGKITGDVKCGDGAKLHPTAFLKGDLYAPIFSIEMGAKFIGTSKGNEIIDLKEKTEEAV